MLSTRESILYFLFGCMPIRILLTLLPIYISDTMLFYYGLVLSVIAGSFLYLYFTSSRMNAFEAGGATGGQTRLLSWSTLFGCIYLRNTRIINCLVTIIHRYTIRIRIFINKRLL